MWVVKPHTTHNPLIRSAEGLALQTFASLSLRLPISFITSDDKNKFVVFLTEFEADLTYFFSRM